MTLEPVALRGEKMVLREKRLSDTANDYRWRTDPELARLDAAVPLRMTFEEYQRMFDNELQHPSPWFRRFAIETPEGQQIGNCMYYDADYVKNQAELGILIGEPEYWGKGYGTDAVNILLEYIFTATPLQRIYLHTLDWNLRAQRSFTKSGFVPIRNVRRNGLTFLLMEVKRDQWVLLREQRAQKEQEAPGPAPDPASTSRARRR